MVKNSSGGLLSVPVENPHSWQKPGREMTDKINNSLRELFSGLSQAYKQGLDISEYSGQYLEKYLHNSTYFISFYSQVLKKSLERLNKPVAESVFVDYGGGCGILSLAASLIGFKTVIFNDIYENQLIDAKKISRRTGIPVDHFICGDAEAFVNKLKVLNVHPDLICSVDVIEHIYDLDRWFKSVSKLDNFTLIFVTGANTNNPVIKRRLKKKQIIAEYHGCEKNVRIDDTFFNTSFLEEREKIIMQKYAGLSGEEIKLLASESRGLKRDDIENMIDHYLKTGITEYHPDHPTNSCDPYTGSWAERLIDLRKLKDMVKSNGMEVDITNSVYSYSDDKLLNSVKKALNLLIKVAGPHCLFLSPNITIEIRK